MSFIKKALVTAVLGYGAYVGYKYYKNKTAVEPTNPEATDKPVEPVEPVEPEVDITPVEDDGKTDSDEILSEVKNVEPEEPVTKPIQLDDTILKDENVVELQRRLRCRADGIDPIEESPIPHAKTRTIRAAIRKEYGEDILLAVEDLC